MRPFYAIGAAILAIAAAPAAGRANDPAAAAPATAPAATGCPCPGAPQVHVSRPHRRVRHVRYHRRRWVPRQPAGLFAPVFYEPAIPSPWDTAYDRGMTLHFRSPDVSGIYNAEAGYPETPEVIPVQPYRFVSGSAVLHYDGVSGVYVPLSQYDAQRLAPAPVPIR